MHTQLIDVRTGGQETVSDLGPAAARFLGQVADGADGLLHVFSPHATAGIAIIETGAGSDDDLLRALESLLPRDFGWTHAHGTPGHGRDHVLPAFVAPYASLPVLGGQLALGTWQAVCLVDTNHDNPDRKVRFSFLPG